MDGNGVYSVKPRRMKCKVGFSKIYKRMSHSPRIPNVIGFFCLSINFYELIGGKLIYNVLVSAVHHSNQP